MSNKVFYLSALFVFCCSFLFANDIFDTINEANLSKIKTILESQPSAIDSITAGGTTPLHLAAGKNNTEIVSILIQKGAKLNSTTKEGFTPLHWAAYMDSAEAVDLLIKQGADVNLKTGGGLTYIDIAQQEKSTNVLKVIAVLSELQKTETKETEKVELPAEEKVVTEEAQPAEPKEVPAVKDQSVEPVVNAAQEEAKASLEDKPAEVKEEQQVEAVPEDGLSEKELNKEENPVQTPEAVKATEKENENPLNEEAAKELKPAEEAVDAATTKTEESVVNETIPEAAKEETAPEKNEKMIDVDTNTKEEAIDVQPVVQETTANKEEVKSEETQIVDQQNVPEPKDAVEKQETDTAPANEEKLVQGGDKKEEQKTVKEPNVEEKTKSEDITEADVKTQEREDAKKPAVKSESKEKPKDGVAAQRKTAVSIADEAKIASYETRIMDGEKALTEKNYDKAYDLFEALREDYPEDATVNYDLGLAAKGQKDFPRARLAFERVLMKNPNHTNARLAMALTYYESGQLDTAREIFESVLAAKPDETTAAKIKLFINDIDSKADRSKANARVDLQVFYDSNVNVGPDSTSINIAPIIWGAQLVNTLDVSKESQPVDAFGSSLSLMLSGTYDQGAYANWSSYGSLMGYNNLLQGASKFESTFIQMVGGQKYAGQKSMTQLPIRYSYISSGHKSLTSMYAFAPDIMFRADKKGRLMLDTAFVVEKRDYVSLNDRDSVFTSVGETCRFIMEDGASSFSLGVLLSKDDTDAAIYKCDALSYNFGFDKKIVWKSSVYLKYNHIKSEYVEKETLAPDKRVDSMNQVVLGINKIVNENLGFDFNYQVSRNKSTFGIYQYDREVATFGVWYSF